MKKLSRLFCSIALAGVISPAWSLDHKDAPLISQDVPGDLADFYIFDSPASSGSFANNTILAVTVNPLSVPSEAPTFQFTPNVRYQIHIDLDGEFPAGEPNAEAGIGDISFIFEFSDTTFDSTGAPSQLMTTTLVTDGSRQLLRKTIPVTLPTLGVEPAAPIVRSFKAPFGPIRLFAGPRDDPAFANAVSFARTVVPQLPAPAPIQESLVGGGDVFGGLNVSAIVMDFPLEGFLRHYGYSSRNLQLWSTAERRQVTVRRASTGEIERQSGPFEQVDRTGNPVLNSLIVPPNLTVPGSGASPTPFRDIVNIQRPLDDLSFGGPSLSVLDVAVASVRGFGVSPSLKSDGDLVDLLKTTLIPDTLKFSFDSNDTWPFNGRALEDDILDLLFAEVVFPNGLGGGSITDALPTNDVPFLTSFPYMAPPQQPD